MKTLQTRDAKASFSAWVAAAEKGCHPGFADVAIAAITQHADLVLLTCNLNTLSHWAWPVLIRWSLSDLAPDAASRFV